MAVYLHRGGKTRPPFSSLQALHNAITAPYIKRMYDDCGQVFLGCLPRMKKDMMCSDFEDVAREYEPLLSDDSSKGLPSSDCHGWTLLKLVVCANAILLVLSASVLTSSGFIQGELDDQVSLSSAFGLSRFLDKGIQLVTGNGMETRKADWACLCQVIRSQFTSFHLKHSEIDVRGFTNSLSEWLYGIFTNAFKKLWIYDGSLASNHGEMPMLKPLNSVAQASRMMNPQITKTHKRSHSLQKAKKSSFLKIVKDLSHEGLLQSHHRILCLDSSVGPKVQALKEKGFINVEHIHVSLTLKASNQRVRNPLVEASTDEVFDFVFTTAFDHTTEPAVFVTEIERLLKVGGFAVMHVSLDAWHNRYIRARPGEAARPVTVLFTMSKIVYVSTAYAPGLDIVIVFKKVKSF